MSSARRPPFPSALLLLGLTACSGTPPEDAPDEPRPDVKPDVQPDVQPENPVEVEDDIPIGALYGAPPDDWDEEELKTPMPPVAPNDDTKEKSDGNEKKKADGETPAQPKADPAE